MEMSMLDDAAPQRGHMLPSVTASSLSALTPATHTVSKEAPVAIEHAYVSIDQLQLGTWATRQSVFSPRLCSVPTSVLTQRGICHGTEVSSQMCDSDHDNFISAARNVA